MTLSDAIKGGVNHSLQACLDVILSAATDDQAAFQYEIEPARLSPDASAAVLRALQGDLSLLTGMEGDMQDGGTLAPGVTMMNSVLSETRKRGVILKINLLGILNYLTVSELIPNSEILTDAVTGDVTIKASEARSNKPTARSRLAFCCSTTNLVCRSSSAWLARISMSSDSQEADNSTPMRYCTLSNLWL